MATEGLSPEGLKRYKRWLAVQRAKGRVPSQSEMTAFLQGELEAAISTSNQTRSLALAKERNRIAMKRTNILEDQADAQEDAAKIAGIGEMFKIGSVANDLSGGLITKGIGAGVGAIGSGIAKAFGSAPVSAAASIPKPSFVGDPGGLGFPSGDSGGGGDFWSGIGDFITDVWDSIFG